MDIAMDIEPGGTGDIILNDDNTDLVLRTGLDARRQHLWQRLRMFFGEWFLDVTRGVPYFEFVLIKAPNFSVIDTLFKSVIINTPGITELTQFGLDFDSATRVLTLTFTAKSLDGIISYKNVPIPGVF